MKESRLNNIKMEVEKELQIPDNAIELMPPIIPNNTLIQTVD